MKYILLFLLFPFLSISQKDVSIDLVYVHAVERTVLACNSSLSTTDVLSYTVENGAVDVTININFNSADFDDNTAGINWTPELLCILSNLTQSDGSDPEGDYLDVMEAAMDCLE